MQISTSHVIVLHEDKPVLNARQRRSFLQIHRLHGFDGSPRPGATHLRKRFLALLPSTLHQKKWFVKGGKCALMERHKSGLLVLLRSFCFGHRAFLTFPPLLRTMRISCRERNRFPLLTIRISSFTVKRTISIACQSQFYAQTGPLAGALPL